MQKYLVTLAIAVGLVFFSPSVALGPDHHLAFQSVPTAHASLLTNIVSYWKTDETGTANAADSAGSNTLTNTNSVTYNTGIINNAAEFDAQNEVLTIANGSLSGLNFAGDFSFSMWVYPTAQPGSGFDMYLINKLRTVAPFANTREYSLIYENNGGTKGMLFLTGTGGSYTNILRQTQTLTLNTWTHLVWTWDSVAGTLHIYTNGVDGGAIAGTPTGALSQTAPFEMGNNGEDTSAVVNLRMDEIGVWSRVLTQPEATSLYNAGVGCQYTFGACTAVSAAFIPLWLPFLQLF